MFFHPERFTGDKNDALNDGIAALQQELKAINTKLADIHTELKDSRDDIRRLKEAFEAKPSLNEQKIPESKTEPKPRTRKTRNKENSD